MFTFVSIGAFVAFNEVCWVSQDAHRCARWVSCGACHCIHWGSCGLTIEYDGSVIVLIIVSDVSLLSLTDSLVLTIVSTGKVQALPLSSTAVDEREEGL